jgi:gamma-glutamyltranspeptidase/glutathione hydrolase
MNHKLLIVFFISLATCLSRAQVNAQHGMVVSDQATASSIGIDIMKAGGNAIDASVATAFALAVTHPAAGNIGGGGFLVYKPTLDRATTIDFRETAPAVATANMFMDKDGELISGLNHNSALAIGVPGTVAGLYLAHQKYGKLPWRQLVMPAVQLARDGIELTYALYNDSQDLRNDPDYPEFIKSYFLDQNNRPVEYGKNWKQPALAATLQLIADHGKDGFYKGQVAQEITTFMKKNGGIITMEDLAQYQAIERQPVQNTYQDYTVYSMPPPSSGGVTLIAMLNLMEQASIQDIPFNSTAATHLTIESMRRGFADRAKFLGDPDFNLNMPIDRLLSKEFASNRFRNLNMERASVSDSVQFGHPYDGHDTTHFSVIDKDGNAVSVTYTLEQSYGSKMGSAALGFIFNNEMGDFNPVPGSTRSNGQIGTDPNVIEPGKRMLSSMTPVIVTHNNQPYLIVGSPGGRTIINTVYQTVLNMLFYNMDLFNAIESMKVHHQWLPDVTYYERHKLSPDTVQQLESMGHNLRPVSQLGRLMGIMIDPASGIYTGVSDSSSPDGAAIGY